MLESIKLIYNGHVNLAKGSGNNKVDTVIMADRRSLILKLCTGKDMTVKLIKNHIDFSTQTILKDVRLLEGMGKLKTWRICSNVSVFRAA